MNLKIDSQSHFGELKSCASALHAVCGKGTYSFAALAATTNRVFLITVLLLRVNFNTYYKNSAFTLFYARNEYTIYTKKLE